MHFLYFSIAMIIRTLAIYDKNALAMPRIFSADTLDTTLKYETTETTYYESVSDIPVVYSFRVFRGHFLNGHCCDRSSFSEIH